MATAQRWHPQPVVLAHTISIVVIAHRKSTSKALCIHPSCDAVKYLDQTQMLDETSQDNASEIGALVHASTKTKFDRQVTGANI